MRHMRSSLGSRTVPLPVLKVHAGELEVALRVVAWGEVCVLWVAGFKLLDCLVLCKNPPEAEPADPWESQGPLS